MIHKIVQDCSSFSFVSPTTSAEGPLPDPFSPQFQVVHHPPRYFKHGAILLPCFYTTNHLIHLDYASPDICSLMVHRDFERSQEGMMIWHRRRLKFLNPVQVGFLLKARLKEGLVFETFSLAEQHYHFN